MRSYDLREPWKVTVSWFSRSSSAGPLLAAFVLADLVLMIYTHTLGAGLNHGNDSLYGQQVIWLGIDAFLARRIWLGARWAWTLALVTTLLPMPFVLIGGVISVYIAGLWVLVLAQAGMLLSPAVRRLAREHYSRTAR